MIGEPDLEAVKLSLRIDDDAFDPALRRQITAATTLANRQAPDAPEELAHEAITRAVAWMFDMVTEECNLGLWRRCGAAGLLAPWTVRRAGVIG